MLNDNFPVMPHQSTMSGKLIGLKSISNNTLKNKFCYDNYVNGKIENEKAGTVVNICGVCYSQEMLQGVRKNVGPALDRNEYLAERLLNDNEIPTILQAYYRLNAHGELLTEVINDKGEVIKTYPKFNHIENYARHSLTGWTYQVSEIHIWDGHIQEVHNISMKRLEEEYGRVRKT